MKLDRIKSRTLGVTCTSDDICNDLDLCYLEKNIQKAIKPEHKSIDLDMLLTTYKDLLQSYWETKIENFTVTNTGIS